MSRINWVSIALVFAAGAHVWAQSAPATVEAKPMDVDARPGAVTLYLGRASVMRSAKLNLQPGVYDLRFRNLPETVQSNSLQARAGGNTKVLSVTYEQQQGLVANSPELAALDARIEDLQRQIKDIAEQRDIIKSQDDFISAMIVKSAAEAGKDSGTDKLDLDAIRKQLAFVNEQRTALLARRRELDSSQRELERKLLVAQADRAARASGALIDRTAVVSIVAPEAGQTQVDLTYLVGNATWEPMYNVRASMSSSTAQLEYEARLDQRTGEDWTDVALTLSTAQPTMAANPPALQPWFVDVQPKEVPTMRSAAPARGQAMEAFAPSPVDLDRLSDLSANAQIASNGPSVTFALPRTVSVKSNSQKQQTTRIATIDTKPHFMYVSLPIVSEAVYLRGEMINASDYQLLPGKASVFMEQDFIGPTALEAIAPGGEFKVHFGIDRSIKVNRQLVAKNTSNTGLLSGGRKTSYDYRISVDNGSGKPIKLELWDRYPISRNEQIQVELVDLSQPLSDDALYVARERPEGLLKWFLNLGPNDSGKASMVVSYGVRINRAKDVEMTALPE